MRGGEETAEAARASKACCAALYSHEGIRTLLGETLHPGGLTLTARVAALLELRRGDRVLDVAAGLATTALHLARSLNCRVEGLDISRTNVAQAHRAAEEAGYGRSVHCLAGDAEALPYSSRVFDAVVSECAFSTFPDKRQTAREIFRVLRPGGRLGLADVTVEPGALPEDLEGLLWRAACLADARNVDGYRSLLLQAGFDGFVVEEHSQALFTLLTRVRARLRLGRLAGLVGLLPLGRADGDAADHIIDQIEGLVRDGKVGYMLLVATRPKS